MGTGTTAFDVMWIDLLKFSSVVDVFFATDCGATKSRESECD